MDNTEKASKRRQKEKISFFLTLTMTVAFFSFGYTFKEPYRNTMAQSVARSRYGLSMQNKLESDVSKVIERVTKEMKSNRITEILGYLSIWQIRLLRGNCRVPEVDELLGDLCDRRELLSKYNGSQSLKLRDRCYNDLSGVHNGPNFCIGNRPPSNLRYKVETEGSSGIWDYYDGHHMPEGSSFLMPMVEDMHLDLISKQLITSGDLKINDAGTTVIVMSFTEYDVPARSFSYYQLTLEKVIDKFHLLNYDVYTTVISPFFTFWKIQCDLDYSPNELYRNFSSQNVKLYVPTLIFVCLMISLFFLARESQWGKLKNLTRYNFINIGVWFPNKFFIINSFLLGLFLFIFIELFVREVALHRLICSQKSSIDGYMLQFLDFPDFANIEKSIIGASLVTSIVLSIRYMQMGVPYMKLDGVLSSLRSRLNLVFKYVIILTAFTFFLSPLLQIEYGWAMHQYSTPWFAILGTLRAGFGEMDFQEMRQVSGIFGPIIYTILLTLYNIFLFPFFIILLLERKSYKMKDPPASPFFNSRQDAKSQDRILSSLQTRESKNLSDIEFCSMIKSSVIKVLKQKHNYDVMRKEALVTDE